MSKVSEVLESLRLLHPGWDSYGAKAFNLDLIDRVQYFISNAEDIGLKCEIDPHTDGRIGVIFSLNLEGPSTDGVI